MEQKVKINWSKVYLYFQQAGWTTGRVFGIIKVGKLVYF